MANFSDYSTGGGQTPANVSGPVESDQTGYWPLSKLKRAYLDYTDSKRNEILEQQDARRYRHGSQYTSEQTKIYNRRKQPIVTYNRIAPKVNGVVGLIEKLRQAPKAYPRTPKEEAGADLATAVVRYVVDEQKFKILSPFCGQDAAVDGLSGIELTIEQGDKGDLDVGLKKVDGEDFFYDPRSKELDFSDAEYMGVGKYLTLSKVKAMFPGKAEEIDDLADSGSELSTNSDRDNRWFQSDGVLKKVRVVDLWYQMDNGEWCWCVFTGALKLNEGASPFSDQKGKTVCKFIMFSANVDQDGDRYGFVRQFKSVQDEINQRRSKAMHIMNSRRILAEDGAFDDIEKTRLEAVRPDGVVIHNKGFEAEFDDNSKLQDMEANLKFYQDAKEEMDSYGPTLSLIGETGQVQSGRAISLQQQAGIAQLGPFMISYKAWKVRVYRAIWNAVRQHWKAERWIRVTDDENAVNFVGLNQVSTDPMTGMPAMVNQVSALDVDIIMEEGPDAINMMQDAFDAMQVLVQNGAEVPPALLVEMSPLDSATKQRWIKQLTQPDPAVEQAKQLELQTAAAKIQDTQAATGLKKAQTIDTLRGEQGGQQGPEEHPAVTAANVENTMADTDLKRAQAMAAAMKPSQEEAKMQADQQKHASDQAMQAHESERERQFKAEDSERNRQLKAHDATHKVQSDQAKSSREDELHKFDMQERQMRLRMEWDQHEHQKKMDERDVGQAVETRKSKAVAKEKTEAGLSTAIQALAQNSKESTNAIVKAMGSLSESANAMSKSAEVMAKAATAPKRVVRDKSGRVSHVEAG
jgi:hypothetical protein